MLESTIKKEQYPIDVENTVLQIIWGAGTLALPDITYFFETIVKDVNASKEISEINKNCLLLIIEKFMFKKAKENNKKPHLSFSQIAMFLRCPKQWEFRYVQNLKIPPSGALILGSSWHETIELNYVQKITSDVDLPLDDMKDSFSDIWTKKTEKEEIDFGEDKPGDLKDLGILITNVHHQNIAPRVKPALVEEEFRISLGEDFPYELLGYFDVIEKDGTVADNKSWKRAKSQADVDKDLQLSAYALGYRVKYGKAEKSLRFDAVIKNKKPKAIQLVTTRTNEDCRWLLGLIEKVADGIIKEAFYPNPNGWHCSKKWCGYWDKCKGSAS
jgi:hypothetical protein